MPPDFFRREAVEHHARVRRSDAILQIPRLARRIFGALRRRRSIPFVQQLTATECGIASLAMVLRYFGYPASVERLRDIALSGRDGTNVRVLLDVARLHGLRGRSVSLDVDQLDYLDRGAILHWGFDHFVVLDDVKRTRIRIVDPAEGRRWVAMPEVRRQFTGVALLLEPDEGFQPPAAGAAMKNSHLRQVLAERGALLSILFASVALQVLGLGLPLLSRLVIDRVIPRSDYHLLLILSVGIVFLLAFQALSSLVRAHLMLYLRTQLDSRMGLGFIEHLFSLPFAFFQQRSAGDLLTRLNSNTIVREILTGTVLSAVLDGTLALGYLVLLLFGSPPLAVLTVGLAILQIVILLTTRQRQRRLLADSLEVQGRSQSYQVETLAAVEELKALGCEDRALAQWASLLAAELNISTRRGRLDAFTEAATGAVRTGSSMALLAIGALEVVGGRLSLGDMMALTAVATSFMAPLISLASSASRLQLLAVYVERLNDVLQAAPERGRSSGLSTTPGITGAVSVVGVSFQYSPISPPVLRSVSMEIGAGEFVALVGRSGSGKSTLARLLVGLYSSTAGHIAYDGVSLTNLDLSALRREIGIVTQQVHLFGATIRENIAMADPAASLERIIEASTIACLHEDVLAMPLGYDTPLTDRGGLLSGGQRQRIALARALVRRPKLLVLDEATNQLDAMTELVVLQGLARLSCTRIVIAHRLSTVARADRIYTLQDGTLVEDGTHVQLMATDGVYAALVAAQAAPSP